MSWVFKQTFSKRVEIAEELREEFENDLRKQLARQTAAHSTHIKEELDSQAEKLKIEANETIQKQLEKSEVRFLEELLTGKNA